ncbi:MAG: sigma-54-dependent Fis family transcriptional regulator [Deltaproteobacteria bacterium]|nr:sigma-54-dependent Fis family transcriptional regulator [Deltaproteobacteria bacterium]
MAHILLVDDEPSSLLALTIFLKKAGHEVTTASDGEAALRVIEDMAPEVVVTDYRMEPLTGLDVLKKVQELQYPVEVILLTGEGTIGLAVEAMKMGAFDFLTKPVKPEDLNKVVNLALNRHSLITQVTRLKNQVGLRKGFEHIVGSSASMQRAIDLAQRVAGSDAPVLLLGESGTGKELFARAIHSNSPRGESPFVAINCGALPEALLESELFGHAKGAFTGAHATKKGLFEEADKGTIFLDEIGDMPLALQVKLLRVLQENEIRRVGDNRTIRIDVRLIAATHRNLKQMVSEGAFREDLYYRLRVIEIPLPPVRERRDDIRQLAQQFWARERKSQSAAISGDALEALAGYSWPGNIRELENAIRHAAVLAASDELQLRDLPSEIGVDIGEEGENGSSGGESAAAGGPPASSPDQVIPLAEAEKTHILNAYTACQHNQVETARRLGIGRNTLWRKLKEYGILKSA